MNRLNRVFTCTVVLACLCWVSAAPAKIVYVDDDATGANDGSSWVNAFRYLQDALAAAAAPDEIRVAQGVYRPDRGANVAVGDRKASFYLVSGTALYGGYAGIAAADPNERDVERYQTILSGDLTGNDADVDDLARLSIEPTRAENSSRVVQCMSVEPTTLLDGCIIAGGMRAGLDNVYGRPSISHCVFLGNAGVNGSAVVNLQGHVTLTGCRFLSNFASGTGGAFYSNAKSSAALVECVFEGNRAFGTGGAVRCHGVSLTLTRCVFNRNLSQKEGGAVSCDGNADVEITGCTFSANEARGHADRSYPRTGGGAVYIADRDVWSDVSVTDCLFEHNRTGETGGAVCSLAPIRLGRNRFTNNVAQRGGGVFVDAGTFIAHCLFAGNQASASGGAVHNLGLGNVLTHCTFAGNVAPGGRAVACHPLFYPGTGALVPLSQVDLSNCIVWDGPGEFSYWLDSGSEITMAYSDIPGGWEGPGNMDVNPCFADPGRWDPNGTPDDPNDDIWIDGDYHLKSQAGRWDPNSQRWVKDEVTSPCIDAGDPNRAVGDEPEPNGGRINMGAYGGTAEASKSPATGPTEGLWSEPLPLAEVNLDAAEEWGPVLSPDGLTLYFTRVKGPESDLGRVFQATRPSAVPYSRFTSVTLLPGALNQSPEHVLAPWFSVDGLRLYYTYQQGSVFGLKVSERAAGSKRWPAGTEISEINQLSSRLHSFRLTRDELTIFFAGPDMQGGGGADYDIWMATRPNRSAPFVELAPMTGLNSTGTEMEATPSADDLALYFASNRNGRYQLFRSTRAGVDGAFGPPVHLTMFDTPGGHSMFPYLSPDGTEFYFVREAGEDRTTRDIWVSYRLD